MQTAGQTGSGTGAGGSPTQKGDPAHTGNRGRPQPGTRPVTRRRSWRDRAWAGLRAGLSLWLGLALWLGLSVLAPSAGWAGRLPWADNQTPLGRSDSTLGVQMAPLLAVRQDGSAPGAPVRSPVLEDVMSLDEIYLNLVKRPRFKPFAPKGNIVGPPYTLPTDPAHLGRSPKAHMLKKIPAHLYPYFDLFLYVNKAQSGPWAQQMFVFEKVRTAGGARTLDPVTAAPDIETSDEGAPNEATPREETGSGQPLSVPATPKDQPPQTLAVTLTDRWLISTGRERRERYFTETPTGLFRLDRSRFYTFIRSRQWDGAAMPHAMFFDWDYRHRKTGYAIHAAGRSTERRLGRRASGGCVRLSRAHAKQLFERIRSGRYNGDIPEFPFDETEGLTARDGRLVRDENGQPVLKSGYKVLLVIDEVVHEVEL